MTEVVVFSGPTISPKDASGLIDADCRGPAALGDVHRAQRDGARFIALIDGYFERVPAVWHKEILWALSHGVQVLGAASIGALRAAELAPFGMEGVGAVFEGYRSGRLRRDDEVAVAHAGPEDDYVPLSLPLVNARATLDLAVESEMVAAADAEVLVAEGGRLFYPERTWTHLMELGRRAGVAEETIDSLGRWVAEHEVDQKRDDAVELLEQVADRVRSGDTATPASFPFEHTIYWDNAMREIVAVGRDEATAADVVDEVRLDPESFGQLREGALLRALTIELGIARGYRVSAEDLQEAADSFRLDRGLRSPAALEEWLAARRLSRRDWHRLVREEAHQRWVRRAAEASLEARVIDHLRLRPDYPALAARAARKRRVLASGGFDDVAHAGIAPPADEVVAWWFESQGVPVPDDLEDRLVGCGMDPSAFLRALRREYWFRRLEENE